MITSYRKHFGFKLFTLVLAMVFLLPSAVKFSHIFNHHHHEVCHGEPQAHLHKSDLDCDFYKFKLGNGFSLPNTEFILFLIEDNHKLVQETYTFLSDAPKIHFSLRGPPQIGLS